MEKNFDRTKGFYESKVFPVALSRNLRDFEKRGPEVGSRLFNLREDWKMTSRNNPVHGEDEFGSLYSRRDYLGNKSPSVFEYSHGNKSANYQREGHDRIPVDLNRFTIHPKEQSFSHRSTPETFNSNKYMSINERLKLMSSSSKIPQIFPSSTSPYERTLLHNTSETWPANDVSSQMPMSLMSNYTRRSDLHLSRPGRFETCDSQKYFEEKIFQQSRAPRRNEYHDRQEYNLKTFQTPQFEEKASKFQQSEPSGTNQYHKQEYNAKQPEFVESRPKLNPETFETSYYEKKGSKENKYDIEECKTKQSTSVTSRLLKLAKYTENKTLEYCKAEFQDYQRRSDHNNKSDRESKKQKAEGSELLRLVNDGKQKLEINCDKSAKESKSLLPNPITSKSDKHYDGERQKSLLPNPRSKPLLSKPQLTEKPKSLLPKPLLPRPGSPNMFDLDENMNRNSSKPLLPEPEYPDRNSKEKLKPLLPRPLSHDMFEFNEFSTRKMTKPLLPQPEINVLNENDRKKSKPLLPEPEINVLNDKDRKISKPLLPEPEINILNENDRKKSKPLLPEPEIMNGKDRKMSKPLLPVPEINVLNENDRKKSKPLLPEPEIMNGKDRKMSKPLLPEPEINVLNENDRKKSKPLLPEPEINVLNENDRNVSKPLLPRPQSLSEFNKTSRPLLPGPQVMSPSESDRGRSRPKPLLQRPESPYMRGTNEYSEKISRPLLPEPDYFDGYENDRERSKPLLPNPQSLNEYTNKTGKTLLPEPEINTLNENERQRLKPLLPRPGLQVYDPSDYNERSRKPLLPEPDYLDSGEYQDREIVKPLLPNPNSTENTRKRSLLSKPESPDLCDNYRKRPKPLLSLLEDKHSSLLPTPDSETFDMHHYDTQRFKSLLPRPESYVYDNREYFEEYRIPLGHVRLEDFYRRKERFEAHLPRPRPLLGLSFLSEHSHFSNMYN